MKHIKLFEEFLNESSTQYYGVDSETERLAGTSNSQSGYRWNNGKGLISLLKRYYIKPALLKTISTKIYCANMYIICS